MEKLTNEKICTGIVTGLERQFGLRIDKDSVVKLSNLKFKGRVEPTVMRKRKADNDTNSGGDSADANKENDPLSKFPYPYEQGVTSEELAKKKAKEVCGLLGHGVICNIKILG